MKNITLKQLRYFEALARMGHFGQAAELCSVSQPALSVQIKELETELGAMLFERGPRHVRLTAFGAEFAPRVRAILQAVDELGDLARTSDGPLAGPLRLGVIPTIAPYLLPRLLAALPVSHPDLDIRVRETITPRLLEELQAGRLDAAIVALPIEAAWVRAEPVGREDFVLVRPRGDRAEPAPDAQSLAAERLLLLEEGHCFRDQAIEMCGLADRRDAGALDGSSLSTLVQMVGAGMGLTLIPEMAITVETRRAAVDVARFSGRAPGRELALIWRATTPLEAQFSELAGAVRRVLSAQPSSRKASTSAARGMGATAP
ncbi:hydrogen peroxide-inducible genes activator [Roseobacteraceae bacterium S113]